MLSITANCKVRCQLKQRYYLVLFCQQVFISSLDLLELEGFLRKKNEASSSGYYTLED